jgi:hypothetical protein
MKIRGYWLAEQPQHSTGVKDVRELEQFVCNVGCNTPHAV